MATRNDGMVCAEHVTVWLFSSLLLTDKAIIDPYYNTIRTGKQGTRADTAGMWSDSTSAGPQKSSWICPYSGVNTEELPFFHWKIVTVNNFSKGKDDTKF